MVDGGYNAVLPGFYLLGKLAHSPWICISKGGDIYIGRFWCFDLCFSFGGEVMISSRCAMTHFWGGEGGWGIDGTISSKNKANT